MKDDEKLAKLVETTSKFLFNDLVEHIKDFWSANYLIDHNKITVTLKSGVVFEIQLVNKTF